MSIVVRFGYGVRASESDVTAIIKRRGIEDADVSIAKKGDLVYYETTITFPCGNCVGGTDREVYRSVTKVVDQAVINRPAIQPSPA